MKRIISQLISLVGKIILLILSFVIGVASTILLSEVSPPTVTLCRLAQNPSWYDGRTIQVEANGRGSFGAVVIADETCQLPGAWAGVWLSENYKPSGEAQKLFTDSDSEAYEARILVTGQFDANATRGCYAPKSAIRATNVELKSAIISEPMKKRTEK